VKQRRAIETILSLPEGPRRTAAIAAWFQSLYEKESSRPILVGGAAVELYTGGAYTTGDLDFVGHVPSRVAQALEEAGFRREGRHWVHRASETFLELPGSSLEPDEGAARIVLEDSEVTVIRPEDLIVDRLAAWQFWSSEIDGINAFLVSRAQRHNLNRHRVAALAKSRKVEKALSSLQAFERKLTRREPSREELEQWASRRV
jgi:hypothetical protein